MTADEFDGAPHPDDPLLLACRRIAQAIDRFDEAACQRLGVGRSDLRALNLLEHGPMSAAALAGQLRLSRASVTTLVDRLERAGYVSRSPDPTDRRSVRVALEPATFAAFVGVYRPLGIQVFATLAGLGDGDRLVVVGALDAMTTAFMNAADAVGEHGQPEGGPDP